MATFVPDGSLIDPVDAGQSIQDPPPNATPPPGSFGSLGALTGMTGGAPLSPDIS